MSTLQIDLTHPSPAFGPSCTRCAGRTRLIGVEPHPVQAHTDLRTYECMACDAVHAVRVPLAS